MANVFNSICLIRSYGLWELTKLHVHVLYPSEVRVYIDKSMHAGFFELLCAFIAEVLYCSGFYLSNCTWNSPTNDINRFLMWPVTREKRMPLVVSLVFLHLTEIVSILGFGYWRTDELIRWTVILTAETLQPKQGTYISWWTITSSVCLLCGEAVCVFLYVRLSVCTCFCPCKAGLLVGWLRGWLVGWSSGWVVEWFVGWLSGWVVEWLICWVVVWLGCWVVGWLVGWLIDWLVSWVFGLAGCLCGWL